MKRTLNQNKMRLGAFEVGSRSFDSGFDRYPTTAVLPQGEVKICAQEARSTSIQTEVEPSYRLLVCAEEYDELEALPIQTIVQTQAFEVLLEDHPEGVMKIEPQDQNLIKHCPFCGKRTFQDGGCNYMKCSESDPPSACPGEWCFLCERPKYRVIVGKERLGFCNESSHNSH